MSHTIRLDIGGRPLSIEIGKVGKQADGSALIRYGDTVMLVTATSKKEVREPKPFLPLIVDYRENTYAAGKIPGGFFKREGRPSEREILLARMIDRPIRPLFPDGYFLDTQIVGLLLSADIENEPDTLGVIGASTALYFSEIPYTAPLGAVKVGIVDGAFVVNPTSTQLETSPLNMTVVGNESGIIMIETGAQEVEEARIIEALKAAWEPIQDIIRAQKDLFATLDIKKRDVAPVTRDPEKTAKMEAAIGGRLKDAFLTKPKKASEARLREILDDLLKDIPAEHEDEIKETKEIYYTVQKKVARDFILKEGRRPDGRAFDEIRPITIEVGLLPRTHGSALFTRGETQSLSTVTLGTFEDVQRIDSLGEEYHKRFMLHYNFPPFSVGEASFLRGPGRREIGHGALAEKGVLPAIPKDASFPYTIRLVSDILESNGSSSMATVCGGVLALMDAGVPLTMTPAGIAMGLVTAGDKVEDGYVILTDIQGLEDHFGDMDFKVVGTEQGVTAIQLDLKAPYITIPMLEEALAKARVARLQVLDKMKAALPAPRPELSPYAPRILILFVNPEKVSEVIGPAGKIIKRIIATTKAKIDIEDDGKIIIASVDMSAAEKARKMIEDITAEAELGKTYQGKVVRIEEYGAFLDILPNVQGLLHVSEIAHHRISSVRDVLKMGDVLDVKVTNIDEDGKVRLSRKALEEPPPGTAEGGEGQPPSEQAAGRPPFKKRPFGRDRGPDRGRDRRSRNRY
ncbi:MAG: polyribonucleotide nucleotidyltransferase [Candidatus Aminicenantes bacterium]|nr:polyribonucleotide nucleotidyltransferase [Candidatus Aminicenantes bacterium]